MIGRRFGHYLVLERIGAGGMGEIYRARDEKLRRDVALKVLPAAETTDTEARARLMREARMAATLNHPNVCTIYEVGEHEGEMFIAMELVEGRALSEMIGPGGLPMPAVRRYGSEIADGLAHAHQRGVVHRDLKSLNVMVTRDGRVKVLDFGLARWLPGEAGRTIAVASRLTATGTVVGTPHYMAPETLHGREADARSDVWALGVLLYEMASGSLPFPGKTHFEIAAGILRAEPARLAESVPSGLRAVIGRCLEKEPGLRYSQAGEVLAALQSLDAATLQGGPRERSRGRSLGVGALVALVAVVAVLVFGLGPDCQGSLKKIRALAVLPLADLSGDPGQDYFTDGLTDELINGLAQVASLKVIARGSVMTYKGTRKTLREIARELGVDVLVEGSVSRAGDIVRVRAQLVRGSNGETLWADSYQRDLRDVLALQSDVARAIIDKVQARLAPGEKEKLATARQVDPEAYQEYLRGRRAWDAYSVEGFQKAEAHFRRALEIDPTYASAWAGLADAIYGYSNLLSPPNVTIPKARAAAEKALEHDPDLVEGHTSIGIVKLVFEWDWRGAEQSFRRAIEARPNDANAHWWLGHLLVLAGRHEEGMAESRKAQELDPLSIWYAASHGWHLRLARRTGEAVRHLREAVRAHPDAYILHVALGQTLQQSGDMAGAVEHLERAVRLSENNDNLSQLASAYATAGRKQDAERVIANLADRRNTQFVPAASLAIAYAGLKDKERTLEWLEAAVEDHSEALVFMKVDAAFDFLRGEPRFQAILKRIGLDR